ncbi:MAG: ABC transporter ATP-binding protein [Phycisphaeraceae bacterium]|nr:ABC transporter ATP-binding protein [Phycisphaeraceae bacterium]
MADAVPSEPSAPKTRLRAAVALAFRSGPRWAVAQVALTLFSGVLPLIGLLLMKEIVDAVAGGVGAADTDPAWARVLELIAWAVGIAAFGAGLRAVSGLVAEGQTQAVQDHVHARLHQKSVNVDLQDLEDPAVLDLLQRAQQEAPVRPGRIVNGLASLGQGGVSLLLMAGLLAGLHWGIAVAVVLAALPGVWIRARHARILHRWQQRRAATDREIRYLGWLLTAPGPAKEVRLFDLGPSLRLRWRTLRRAIRGERFGLAGRRALGELLTQSTALVVTFGAYAFVAREVLNGDATIGGLVMYVQAVQRGQAAVQSIFGALAGLHEDALFLSAFFAFTALPAKVPSPASPRPFPEPLTRGLLVEDVGFRYPAGGPDVLDGVSFCIRPGERVALVGENGAGKSTLVKLLCRFYDPVRGRIALDDVDLRSLDRTELVKRIAPVFQDFVRFDLSARDNVCLSDTGSAEEDDDRVESAAAAAGVLDRLRALPDGLDTRLGRRFDGGAELSIGEWQKVAIARALFRDAPLVLMDEPTSALDPAAEAEILDRLLELASGRTALIVSHRLSTARRCDRILVLHGGRLVEEGAHEELVQIGGTYARLFHAQSRPYA